MGLGGTARKIQKLADSAEKLYTKMNEIIGELRALQEEVEETSAQVDRVERDMAEQRALVDALAREQGIDVDEVLASADLPPGPEDASGDDSDSAADSAEETVDESENADGDADETEVPVTENSPGE